MSFWQTEVQQRCFSAWRNARNAQLEKAESLRRKQLLQKGLKALKFAISQQRQNVSELQIKAATRVMAKYWLKVAVSQKQLLRLTRFSALKTWVYYLGMTALDYNRMSWRHPSCLWYSCRIKSRNLNLDWSTNNCDSWIKLLTSF